MGMRARLGELSPVLYMALEFYSAGLLTSLAGPRFSLEVAHEL